MVLPSPAMALLERRIANLAVMSRLPVISILRGFAEACGLMSYGAHFSELFGRATALMDRILKGAKPADLPIERPQKFELVINLNTAQALGLTLPPHLLVLRTRRSNRRASGRRVETWPVPQGVQPWGDPTPSLTMACRRRLTASAALPLPAAPDARRWAAKRERREPLIEHETLEPQEMIDGLVQVLREVYANDTF